MKQPIGVFDSGIGGTSILKELVKLLPHENVLYLADSANAPYGEKSPEEIIRLCKKNVDFLLDKGCKIIVVACNTATTNAIKILRGSYNVPFIGIEPAIKPAALGSKTKNVGILATKGTLSSALFAETLGKYTEHINIIEVVGKGLVEHIEKGDFDSPALQELVLGYIAPMIEYKVDYIVLGCSHYPYLIPMLHKLLPKTVTIIDSGEAVAKQTKHILTTNGLINSSQTLGTITFITNADLEPLRNISDKNFLQAQVQMLNF